MHFNNFQTQYRLNQFVNRSAMNKSDLSVVFFSFNLLLCLFRNDWNHLLFRFLTLILVTRKLISLSLFLHLFHQMFEQRIFLFFLWLLWLGRFCSLTTAKQSFEDIFLLFLQSETFIFLCLLKSLESLSFFFLFLSFFRGNLIAKLILDESFDILETILIDFTI